MAKRTKRKSSKVESAFFEGLHLVEDIPLLHPIYRHVTIVRSETDSLHPRKGWAAVSRNGAIHVNPGKYAEPGQWVYVLAHCMLHLGFGHFKARDHLGLWNVACDCFVARFLENIKLGTPPGELFGDVDFSAASEDALYKVFQTKALPDGVKNFGVGDEGADDMIWEELQTDWWGKSIDWPELFGKGLSVAVSEVVQKVAGVEITKKGVEKEMSDAQKARNWFISSYPLLGALAASFKLIEDRILCGRMKISVAAVNPEMGEIYINPAAGMDSPQYRFVVAHELLHVGLRHDIRAEGRDPYFWNVACDYVINSWLIEMEIGEAPGFGVLYDKTLSGLSAESVYDIIVTDLRRLRKLSTFRGRGSGDIIYGPGYKWWEKGKGLELDEFYRRCLGQGLEYHQADGRGFLPAGLVEEIRALSQPPIPWDVELAKWFDDHFSPLEKRRTFSRPNRRQSATPDIPRPSWAPAQGARDGRTFGVVLDTSGSMSRSLLAKALGAISGYSISRDVLLVRVVFCDATFYDQGYMRSEDIADRVKIRGRGGTIIQPAVDMLEKAEDFPKEGPLLVITDGFCDRLRIRREHAFLLPRGGHLPFAPRGKVFYIT
ncbi:MAG: peptidase [Desulfobacterales bacterium]|nr:peptidase [Desulfobacterales bacterium]